MDQKMYKVQHYYKTMEPVGWEDNGIIMQYNAVIKMDCKYFRDLSKVSKLEDSNKVQEVWMPFSKEPIRPKHRLAKIKKHIWKPGEKCMAPWNNGFYKGEIKHSIPKHKTVSVWFELFDVLEDFYINEVHPRHFFTNGDAGTSNKNIEWQPGDPCLAMYYNDGNMYNAVIQEINISRQEAVLYYELMESAGNHIVFFCHIYPTHLNPDYDQLRKMRLTIPKEFVKQDTVEFNSQFEINTDNSSQKRFERKLARSFSQRIERVSCKNVMKKSEIDDLVESHRAKLKYINDSPEKRCNSIRYKKENIDSKKSKSSTVLSTRKAKDDVSNSSFKRAKIGDKSAGSKYSYKSRNLLEKTKSADIQSTSRIVKVKNEDKNDELMGVKLPCQMAPEVKFHHIKPMQISEMDKEALTNMLIGWYMAGYHTGVYRAFFVNK